MKLVLASASPRRVELLGRLGIPFVVEPAHADEWERHPDGPAALVSHNAAMKAQAISAAFPDSWILGSDTTVARGEKIFGKPSDLDDARRMLAELSGKTHTVFTAVCLMHVTSGQNQCFCESARVTFKPLSADAIDAYIRLVNPLDKAGAYGIQAHRERIIAAVEGSVETVMGLPLQALAGRLREIGWSVPHL
jgi:septum formation protein